MRAAKLPQVSRRRSLIVGAITFEGEASEVNLEQFIGVRRHAKVPEIVTPKQSVTLILKS
jgi:hypothetical protein